MEKTEAEKILKEKLENAEKILVGIGSEALAIMRRAEKNLGFPLTARRIGGKGGGGSVLTPKAKEFLHDYETYRDACIQSSRELYTQIFSKYADGGEDGE